MAPSNLLFPNEPRPIDRSRSLSRSSQPGPSSFRASLGGKVVGPKYTGSGKRAALTSGFEPRSFDGSAFANEDMEITGREIEFSASREELRDGSARLAFLSLSASSPSDSDAESDESVRIESSDTLSNLGLARPQVLSDQIHFDREGNDLAKQTKVTVLGDQVDESAVNIETTVEESDTEDEVFPTERTPLLSSVTIKSQRVVNPIPEVGGTGTTTTKFLWTHINKKDAKKIVSECVSSLPAVMLGTLMNLLDGISYGMITFPSTIPVFANYGGIGVSMFFMSCVVSQLVYSGGGSIFKGGNGSMMIEVVPFFHVICTVIASSVDDEKAIVATSMTAIALSSLLTGLAFWTLGALRLGRLCEFFPRHILVGCIGGVGAFLFITGLQVSARLDEQEGMNFELVKYFFTSKVAPLWITPLALAISLRVITSKYSHPLIFPVYFIAIPLVFYAITIAGRFSIQELRYAGWIFEIKGVNSKWYEYLTHFDFSITDWSAIVDTLPTQFALVFFGLLHVPINVPALAISVGEDNVDTDRELIAHGISNVFAGFVGTVPNYLCYINSVLFYKLGGTTRVSGFMLAFASVCVLLIGPGIIGYLPVCVVGALIFILGIDLVKEAVFDTYGRVSKFEYATIWTIVIVMTLWDFVVGIGVGIILACVSFVVMSSQRRAVRSIVTGKIARSTVRRHPKQNAFLKAIGTQTRVIKLQGFLFFGTISSCEATIRRILEAAEWSSHPVRFLILDFSLANGVDFSAAEAFVRMQRLLEDKDVVLVICGCTAESPIGKALRSVDLWATGDPHIQVFQNLNDSLEHCENAYLRSLFSPKFESPRIAPIPATSQPLTSHIDVSDFADLSRSPRQNQIRFAAKQTMSRGAEPPKTQFSQPLAILLQSLRPYLPELDELLCQKLVPYFTREEHVRDTVLWTKGEQGDSVYLIESGMLRANYVFLDKSHSVSQSMVSGTVAGELSFLSRTKRTSTVSVERDSILWKLSTAKHEEMGQKEDWLLCRKLEQCLLRIAAEEEEVMMGHLISSL